MPDHAVGPDFARVWYPRARMNDGCRMNVRGCHRSTKRIISGSSVASVVKDLNLAEHAEKSTLIAAVVGSASAGAVDELARDRRLGYLALTYEGVPLHLGGGHARNDAPALDFDF